MEGILGCTNRRLSRVDGDDSLGGSFPIQHITAKAVNRMGRGRGDRDVRGTIERAS
jgi:hypothetical protein